jgi:alpha-galactosidase
MKNLTIAILILSSGNHLWANQTSASWKLATDDTVMSVEVRQEQPVITELSSVKGKVEWLLAPVPERLPSSVKKKGSTVLLNWHYQEGTLDSKTGELVLSFSNSAPALELRSIWRARPGHGPIEHWLTITNRSEGPITIGQEDSLALSHIAIPTNGLMNAWWIKRGGSNATTEGGTLVQGVGQHSNVTLTSDPMDGASPVPWLALEVGTSRGLYVGWEFSGVGRIHYHGEASPGTAQLGIEIGNVPEFETEVKAGEMFLVPPAFVGCYSGDIDDGSYTLHRFVLEKLVPELPSDYVYPTLAYNLYLDAGGAHADEKSVLKSAAMAHKLGFETFVIDALWFPQSGEWRWDPKRFPHGSQPIGEYIHSHGMKLGLWMAYTQGASSDDPKAMSIEKHPDWFAAPPKLNPKGRINFDAQIDLGSDPARNWAMEATQRAVSEYGLDYLKTDHTPIVTTCEQNTHRHHYGVDVSYWSTLGYYAVQEALIQKFPNLILEGCSRAGHIKDFGDIQRVHMIAVTDNLSSLPDRQAIYDSTFAFPPAVLMSYTYENFYNNVSDAPEPYLWRSSMMDGWQIDPTNSANWTPEQRAKVERATEIYKSWIRPILQDVEVHHILPRPDGYHWDGLFYWSPSLKHGTLYIFRPDSRAARQYVVLKGLNPTASYKVHAEDHSTVAKIYSGRDLMNTGLLINLPAEFTSDLIYFEERP